MNGILSLIVFLPVVGVLLIVLLGRRPGTVRTIAATVAVANLLLSLWAWAAFDPSAVYEHARGGISYAIQGLQHVDRFSWIPAINAEYFLGVDGLSMPMVLLGTLLGVAAVFASWHVTSRVREYFIWLLLLQTSVLGVFTSLDFLLFFLFWELELVPMYFLISIWGTGKNTYSAMKFALFTFLAGALLLIGLLTLYFSTGTFDIMELMTLGRNGTLTTVFLSLQGVYLALLIGFAIKLPVVPLHTWLPDAHTDAPTAVSVMLAGVMLKMGGYGLIRMNVGIFPDITRDWGVYLAALGVISIIWGAVITIRQSDLKRLVAYSSVSHMGLVLLGVGALTELSLTGASLQMFTHGTITGLLFLLVGLIYDKAHTRHIPDLGGLAKQMPLIAVAFVVAGMASLGLPATSGFVAEIMVFLGSFGTQGWATAAAAFGVVLAAGYILWTVERVLFGPSKLRFAEVTDAAPVDTFAIALLGGFIILVGVYPSLLTNVLKLGISQILGS